jgi:chemotaxis methyl-accepting protein methylase
MNDLKNIISFLHVKRGLDFSVYRTAMLNRRIYKRIIVTNLAHLNEYKDYLEQNNSELDKLIDVLTINVSRIFRDTFSFEFFASQVLPKLLLEKNNSKDRSEEQKTREDILAYQSNLKSLTNKPIISIY